MFGLLKDLGELVGETVGTVAGIAIAPLAIALDVSEATIKAAIKAGCKTEREIRRWVRDNQAVFSKQKWFCSTCGKEQFSELPKAIGRTFKSCSVTCDREMQWRETLSILGKDYVKKWHRRQ